MKRRRRELGDPPAPSDEGRNSHEYDDLLGHNVPFDVVKKDLLEKAGMTDWDVADYIPHMLEERSTIGFTTKDDKIGLELTARRGLDFVYDKRSGWWFVDLRPSHEMLREQLYRLWKGRYESGVDEATQYLIDGMGFYQSTSILRPYIMMGENYTLPAEFKVAFSGRTIKRID